MSIADRSRRDPDIAPDLLAHDLRAAAAGVITSLAVIGDDDLNEVDRRSLNQARVAAETLKDLLDISMGVGAIAATIIPLSELALRIENRWRDTAEEKGLRLAVNVAVESPSALFCARPEVNRIFDNLLGNALKYCDAGDVIVGISGNTDGGLGVTIDDDGPGFSDKALHKLFEIHGRPQDSSKVGTGLGLFITKSLMDRLGADISVTNRKGSGARITLSFPIALCVEIDPDDQSAAAPIMRNGLPNLSGLHILVAEDNMTNQLVVGQMLAAMGARYEMASDGVEALEMFEQSVFDLVLLDIEMPRLTGLDVIRRIRARADGRETTPLLALTAYAMPDHVRRIKEEGASGLIAKPLTSLEDFGNVLLSYTLNQSATSPVNPAPLITGKLDEVDQAIYNALAKTIGPEVMSDLLEKIASDLGDVHEKLQLGRDQQNVGAVRDATHVLISVAGAIGGTNLQHFAQILNAEVKVSEWPKMVPKIEQAIEGVENILTFVAKEIGNW